MKKAVILLSGGLDSATCLAIARQQGFSCYAISFQYGQRSQFEIEAARRVSHAIQVVEHRIFNIDIGQFGGSALVDQSIQMPDKIAEQDIPITYVPARNTVFLSIALAWAEVLDARDIFIGVNQLDYSGYPDCRAEYIKAFAEMANLGTKAGVSGDKFRFHTPLIDLNKADIIRTGLELGVDYALTCSCYAVDEQGQACGQCESCQLRQRGFEALGLTDPAI